MLEENFGPKKLTCGPRAVIGNHCIKGSDINNALSCKRNKAWPEKLYDLFSPKTIFLSLIKLQKSI